ETFEPVELVVQLPDEAHGTPITYLSSNDLLNMVMQLRSFPDLVEYLDARAKLPREMRRVIGREKDLYAYYLWNGETFEGCRGFADIDSTLVANSHDLMLRLAEKQQEDVFARMIEYASDCLAGRLSDYTVGLDAATLAMYDPPDARTNYTKIQEHL